jgi:N-carbamoylputrescine amidase
MAKITVGVCEGPPAMEPGSQEWNILARNVRELSVDLFLINEMPFGPWISAGESFNEDVWSQSCEMHESGMARLSELGARIVLGTRPRELDGLRVNEAFVWTEDEGYKGVHTKQYFPNEAGYYEARWFQPAERHFHRAPAGPATVGFLICTEVMFNEHARRYGRDGAQIIAVPRAVGNASLPRWLVAMRMSAVVSGCYVLSSNRGGIDAKGQEFGGRGWIVDPNGDMVGQTSAASPVISTSIDLDWVHYAQGEYPCYVRE